MEIIFQLKCADCSTEENSKLFQHIISTSHRAHRFMKQKDALLRCGLNLASYDAAAAAAAASALIDFPCSTTQSRLLVL